MDEPLASLDAPLKARVLAYLQRVVAEWNVPTLFVTHGQAEVRRAADWVVVIQGGRLVGQRHARRGPRPARRPGLGRRRRTGQSAPRGERRDQRPASDRPGGRPTAHAPAAGAGIAPALVRAVLAHRRGAQPRRRDRLERAEPLARPGPPGVVCWPGGLRRCGRGPNPLGRSDPASREGTRPPATKRSHVPAEGAMSEARLARLPAAGSSCGMISGRKRPG